MLSKIGMALFITAVCVGSSATAVVRHKPHQHHHTRVAQSQQQPRVYGCSAEGFAKSSDYFSHMQPGEMAIMIQDRGYRESVGSPFWSCE
jgi:hypothetical protein